MGARRISMAILAGAAGLAWVSCRSRVETLGAEPRWLSPALPSARASWFPAPSQGAPSLQVPEEQAPLAELKNFVQRRPDHPASLRLGQIHDQRLLPCPGASPSASCKAEVELVARGLLERGRAYLGGCLLCRDRPKVEALVSRLTIRVLDLSTERAWQRFDQASLLGPDQAEQIVVDATDVYRVFTHRARARLSQQRQRLGLLPHEAEGECRVPDEFGVLVSPARPVGGAPVRVLVAREAPLGETTWEITPDPQGTRKSPSLVASRRSGAGPPSYALGELGELPIGQYRVRLANPGGTLLCLRLRVASSRPEPRDTGGIWQSTRGWDRKAENLYSAWLSILFDAPEPSAWRGLHRVTRDPGRNLLFDHLGLGEDTPRGIAEHYLLPDCADAPYYLRAYFAWKLGLPFGHHDCRPPTPWGPLSCVDWTTNELVNPQFDAGADGVLPSVPADPVLTFARFLNQLKNAIHAGSLRTPLGDQNTDLYPVPLTRTALRPGVVYSDPYGHTLTLVRWVAQTQEKPGQLLAVDAQPDGTVGIKRFWRGNFLFTGKRTLGGFGFKAFRPIVLFAEGTRLLNNWEISAAEGYGNYSLEQSELTASSFYAKMERLINPLPPSPTQVFRELHEALYRQLEARVLSIEIAEEHWAGSHGRVVDMPLGRGVFNTSGPWEAFSTPCRDLRLLVGMDVLKAYPDEASILEPDLERAQALKRDLLDWHGRWVEELAIRYRRSDGSSQKLSLAELLRRAKNLETAYNPNDCPELRWGAWPDSDELSTCRRRAPEEQRRRMEELRHWFAERYACG
jgi:hypothetical protein